MYLLGHCSVLSTLVVFDEWFIQRLTYPNIKRILGCTRGETQIQGWLQPGIPLKTHCNLWGISCELGSLKSPQRHCLQFRSKELEEVEVINSRFPSVGHLSHFWIFLRVFIRCSAIRRLGFAIIIPVWTLLNSAKFCQIICSIVISFWYWLVLFNF